MLNITEKHIKNDDNNKDFYQNLWKSKKTILAKSKNLKNYQNLSKFQKTNFNKAKLLLNLIINTNIKAITYLTFNIKVIFAQLK